jgi:hypothetical protein
MNEVESLEKDALFMEAVHQIQNKRMLLFLKSFNDEKQFLSITQQLYSMRKNNFIAVAPKAAARGVDFKSKIICVHFV